MKAGYAHYTWTGAPDPRCRAGPEAEVRDGYGMAQGEQGGRHIFKAQGLDPEKGAEPELFTARIGAQEKDIHGQPRTLSSSSQRRYASSSPFSNSCSRLVSAATSSPAVR